MTGRRRDMDVLYVPALVLATGLGVGAAAWGAGQIGDDPQPTPRPTTTTTSVLPWCEGESLVIPGTGIVEFAPRCDQPPEHEPPGTGPTTGPNGEPHP